MNHLRIVALISLVAAPLLSGCVASVPKRGIGTRQTFNGTIDELRAAALKEFDTLGSGYTSSVKPDMVRAVHGMLGIGYTYFLTPASDVSQIDVEMVCQGGGQGRYCEKWHLDRLEQTLATVQMRKGGSGGGLAIASRPTISIRSDVDDPGFSAKASPNDVALIVGVEKYQNVPNADFAERDAATVKEYMKSLGVTDENIVLLIGQRATRTGLAKYVEEWLPRNVKPGSRVYFYYSGHGAPDPADGASYLVPYDGDPAFLKTSAYPLSKLYESLALLKSKQTVVMLDSCFSGSGGRSVLAKGLRPLVNMKHTAVPANSPISIMTASSSAEVTGSMEDQGHGLFTYHLLKGLQGGAAKGGHIDLESLFIFVRKAVTNGARLQNREQTPQLTASDPSLRLY